MSTLVGWRSSANADKTIASSDKTQVTPRATIALYLKKSDRTDPDGLTEIRRVICILSFRDPREPPIQS
jgi:hypothetical protein